MTFFPFISLRGGLLVMRHLNPRILERIIFSRLLFLVMVSTAKSVCLDVQTMPQVAKIRPQASTTTLFDSRNGKFSVYHSRKKETLVHRLKCENDRLLKSTVIILMKRSSKNGFWQKRFAKNYLFGFWKFT